MKYHLIDPATNLTMEVTREQFEENQKRALEGKAARLQAKIEPKAESKPESRSSSKAADK